jgi:GNAT acetyltransferase-like protein
MTISIDAVTTPTDAEWSAVWQACDHATYFHSPEWARLWASHGANRTRPTPKLVKFSDGRSAVIPLSHESKLGGLLSRYVSSSEGTFGGWLSREPLTIDHGLLLLDWLLKRQGKNLVWRMNPYDDLAFRAGRMLDIDCRPDETHALDLRVGLDALFKRFKSAFRSHIRKALDRGGFEVAPATTLEDWHAYYRVYQDSLQRWGHDKNEGYAWRLFEGLYSLRSPHVKLWLARSAGEIVSGNICFYAKRHVVYWHGSTLKEHLPSNVAKLVMYEAIKDAVAAGHHWFDFNPSAGLSGVKFFKEGFNAQPLPAPIVYVDTTLKQLARSCAARMKVQYAKLELSPLAVVSPVAAPFESGPVSALAPAGAPAQAEVREQAPRVGLVR